MQVLLLTNSPKQAEFIQKGLRYENLSCDILMLMSDYVYALDRVPLYDGIFLLLNEMDEKRLNRLIYEVKLIKDLPVFVLLSENSQLADVLMAGGFVSGVFIRPFPFRNMSSDMKYEIFEQKERLRTKKYILRDLELDVQKHVVAVNGRCISLRNKEFELLHFLMKNAGKVVSRTTILENVWDRNTDILTNTVDVHISQLRKKIESLTANKFVRTIPCMGYVLE